MGAAHQKLEARLAHHPPPRAAAATGRGAVTPRPPTGIVTILGRRGPRKW